MLWFDGKGVAHFKKSRTGVAKVLMERLTKWTGINCFFSSDRRGAGFFLKLQFIKYS